MDMAFKAKTPAADKELCQPTPHSHDNTINVSVFISFFYAYISWYTIL